MNTPTKNHDPNLLIDPEHGVLLEVPPTAVVSRRYCESHPFIEVVPPAVAGGDTFVVAGQHAKQVARGSGGTEYALYVLERETAGFLHLRRES